MEASPAVLFQQCICLFLLTVSCLQAPVSAHKILLFPYSQGFSSHLLDMIKLGTILEDAGHDVNFLVAEHTKGRVEGEGFSVDTFPVPTGVSQEFDLSEMEHLIFNSDPMQQVNVLWSFEEKFLKFCGSLLAQKDLHVKLQEEHYDLLVYDASDFCFYFLVEILKVPAIVYHPIGYVIGDRAHFPPFPSFIPGTVTSFTDDMDFYERCQNFIELMMGWLVQKLIFEPDFKHLSLEHGISYDLDTTAKSLHFVHSNFALDFARPLNPNIINIGGIFSRPGNPLPEDLEAFMSSSGSEGVIVVCFGTLISTMDERQDKFARVFARLPHKVVWRYSTKAVAPKGLGANTLLLDWLPQNDLLAHPSTKVFVTHCGMSSTYEAAHHAVPVLAIPVWGDQSQNAHKLVTKAKMGLKVDFHTFTEDQLYNAIMQITSNKTYKEQALRTSKLLHTQPVPLKQQFLHYVDLVGQENGVDHLLQPAMWRFSFIQLYCLDIAALVLVISVGGCFVMCFICRRCCRLICGRGNTKEKLQ